jgi:hypothetical protein
MIFAARNPKKNRNVDPVIKAKLMDSIWLVGIEFHRNCFNNNLPHPQTKRKMVRN